MVEPIIGPPPCRAVQGRGGRLRCPDCGLTSRTIVIDSRKLDQHIWRRRVCSECGTRFTTTEVVE